MITQITIVALECARAGVPLEWQIESLVGSLVDTWRSRLSSRGQNQRLRE